MLVPNWLHDVRSDGGTSARARRRDDDAGPNDHDEAADEQPTTDRGNHADLQVDVRGLERGTHPIFAGAVGLARGDPLTVGVPGLERGGPPTEPTPHTETAPSSTTYALSQNLLSDGCNFGTTIANSRQDTHIAVEQVINVAEGLQTQAMASMAEQAQWDHQQQMARVIQEAQEALQRQSHEARVLLETQAHNYAAECHNFLARVQAAAP